MSWKRELLDDELDELLAAAANYDLKHDVTVRTLAYTGLRANEFAHLKSDWIDWQNEHVRVPSEEDGWTPKNPNAVRTIPVRDPDALRVLREFLKRNDGVGVTRKATHDRVTQIAGKTEIRKKVTPHVLQHTYGTIIARKGASPQYIRQTTGHADLSSGNTYLQYTGQQLDAEADEV
jgi:integrase/recombinase XerD